MSDNTALTEISKMLQESETNTQTNMAPKPKAPAPKIDINSVPSIRLGQIVNDAGNKNSNIRLEFIRRVKKNRAEGMDRKSLYEDAFKYIAERFGLLEKYGK